MEVRLTGRAQRQRVRAVGVLLDLDGLNASCSAAGAGEPPTCDWKVAAMSAAVPGCRSANARPARPRPSRCWRRRSARIRSGRSGTGRRADQAGRRWRAGDSRSAPARGSAAGWRAPSPPSRQRLQIGRRRRGSGSWREHATRLRRPVREHPGDRLGGLARLRQRQSPGGAEASGCRRPLPARRAVAAATRREFGRGQHSQIRAAPRRDGIELRVVQGLGDRQRGDAHRARCDRPPEEQDDRHRRVRDRARGGRAAAEPERRPPAAPSSAGAALPDRVQQHLERGEPRVDARALRQRPAGGRRRRCPRSRRGR